MEDYQLYRSDKQQEELRLLMRTVLRSPTYTDEEADQAVVGFRLLFMILLVAGLEEDCLTPALQVPQTSLENLKTRVHDLEVIYADLNRKRLMQGRTINRVTSTG